LFGKWNAVADQLPDAPLSRWSEPVLAVNDAGNMDVESYYHKQDGGGFWLHHREATGTTARVTHWMPLPDLPNAQISGGGTPSAESDCSQGEA